jgi:hypothetical protein
VFPVRYELNSYMLFRRNGKTATSVVSVLLYLASWFAREKCQEIQEEVSG